MDIDNLALVSFNWANEVFPNRTDQSMFLKLYGEIAEMIDADDQHVGGEIADVLIMILDYAKRRGININSAVLGKMDINRRRVWKQNHLGAFSHVKEPLRISGESQSGDSDAPERRQALAYDRDKSHSDISGTYGERCSVRVGDSEDEPSNVFLIGHDGGRRIEARLGREFHRRHAESHEVACWERTDGSGRIVRVTVTLPESGRAEGETPPEAL